MSLLAVGLNYRSAPLAVLERASLTDDDQAKALHELVRGEHIAEAVVLSTCNRVEVYAVVTTFHGGLAEVSDLFARTTGLPLEKLAAHLYVHHDARAVQHLFSVASGLDSMLVGETQIIGQLRAAFRAAQTAGSAGRVLGELLRHTLRVGKQVRTETDIDRAGASLVGVGLRIAEESLGSLAGRGALVVGAGATAGLAAASLSRAGVSNLMIANRTPARGAALAASYGGRSLALTGIAGELDGVDVVVMATAGTDVLLEYATVAAAVQRRSRRSLFLLDLALPHGIDPSVRELPGVGLINLEALRVVLEREPAGADVEAARAIIADEVTVFGGWQRAMRVAPTVVALRGKAEALVTDELERLATRLPELDDTERDEVAKSVRRVVDKLLHAPTVRVRQLAQSPGGDAYADALRELFELDPAAAAAVSAPDSREMP